MSTQLEAKNISFRYHPKAPWVIKNLNLSVEEGESVALVGPSGYGKSTLSKILAGYEMPQEGEVLWDGSPLPEKGYCPVQMIYQHPECAVNDRWRMKKIVSECWEPPKEFLDSMGIEEEWMNRFPAELSGGELQRFCIARVLGSETKFLICDEISTMLDVITQAQIWAVIKKHAKERNLGMIVVTHNMDLARQVCDRIVELPKINEIGE